MSLFRLHPHLQHAIVNDLGWRSLRPVQELTIDAVLDGCNSVVLAPTAGGKTEAAMFPLLSRILSESLRPVSVLYVCPIRALLNNQEDRLQSYAKMVGLDVFKWHGDVSDSRKRGFRASPAHVLMTTPESLEVMLVSARTDARALFAGLSAVVIDEVHAFAADDRGAHLAALMERLTSLCERDLQRIGLSATVGNPGVIGQWLQGSSERPFRLVDPPKPMTKRALHVDFRDGVPAASSAISTLTRGKKSLVFVESRSRAEQIAGAVTGGGVEVFIHHSAVSRADRALAEQQFASGENTAIVCTSTMELGIDVGDLDQVVQVDAPSSVASFLQRIGRTGRRAGSEQRCTFVCLTPESLLQSVAILRLVSSGWVEDVRPAAQAMHVLAHQIMALSLQEKGISRHRLLPWVESAYPFTSVREARFHELVDTMVERQILHEADGLLSLGTRGEKLYGRRNFFELYAVFTAPPILRVTHGREEVGTVQSFFVSMHDREKGPLCFRLAGRSWEVEHVDWSRGVLKVRPSTGGRVPSWIGMPSLLSTKLCQSMLDVLLRPGDESEWLGAEAAQALAELRRGYEGLLAEATAPIEEDEGGVRWHTFAGGAVNRLLAAGLESLTGKRWVAGNLSIHCRDAALTEATDAARALPTLDWERVASAAAHAMARGMVSKFQPCLPEDAEDRLLAERLLDVPGTLRFLATTSVNGTRPATRPAGARLVDAEAAPARAGFSLDLPPRAEGPRREAHTDVLWVDTPAALRDAARDLRAAEVVGLDVETGLDFGTLCLVQLATAERTYLVDPFAVGSLDPLRDVLAAETPAKVIHNARFERRVLGSLGLELGGVFDTLEASRRLRGRDILGGHGLAMVCERELGLTLDKAEQTSNWSRRPLDGAQLRYAASDAEVLLLLHERLRGGRGD
ncbi:MAG TPA: DEAD/DEAH box helicase [Polyangiaceae bacterium]|nr:DEAD/DEAH box helicase [Polyangiaceae bacterium]